MPVWLVRAGSGGRYEDFAIERGVVIAGWSYAGNIGMARSKADLLTLLQRTYPDQKPKALINWSSQAWPFVSEIKPGHIVALPLKRRPFVAFGRVTGGYRFDPEAPHDCQSQLPVQWLKEIPRSEIAQDILYSLGAFMTVCRIWRNDAEARIMAMLEGGPVPVATGAGQPESPDDEAAEVDIEEVLLEQIRAHLYAKFKGHGLSRLVAAVLEAQGYRTSVSPAGPDGGVDVVAGSGPLGFEAPRIVVQVKSEQSAIDVKVIRELHGVMKGFGADHGLVVAWGGFKSSVARETSKQFFEIRLWSSDDLVRAILEHYDKLSEDIRAELPLRRLWSLIVEAP